MPKMERRNALAHTGALLASFATVVTAAEAAPNIPDTDRELMTLAAELRTSVATYNDDPEDDEQLEQESFTHINGLIDRMVALPAVGFAGVAAKAGWMCELLAEAGGAVEAELVASMAADLARLMPDAVALSS